MTLIYLIIILALERFWLQGNRQNIWRPFAHHTNLLERKLNTSTDRHSVLAWPCTIILPFSTCLLDDYALNTLNSVLEMLWNTLLLTLTTSFKHFYRPCSDIDKALTEGRNCDAKARLLNWINQNTSERSFVEISRLTVKQALKDSYHYAASTKCFFISFPVHSGDIFYHLCPMLNRKWGSCASEDESFGRFLTRVAAWPDWITARLTAASFASIGKFDDAVY